MCTVTYVPTGDEGFFLTSNRDEKANRQTFPPKKYGIKNQTLIYPRDAVSGGTWIAVGQNGTIACLLNGGLVAHKKESNYKHSRGLIIPLLYNFGSVQKFISKYDFDGIEPFTLVTFQMKKLLEICWTGETLIDKELPTHQQHIWASTTLYDQACIAARKKWFQDWQDQNQKPSQQDIVNFHKFAGNGDKQNDIIMQREGSLRTVSITLVKYTHESVEMTYHDLTRGQHFNCSFSNGKMALH